MGNLVVDVFGVDNYVNEKINTGKVFHPEVVCFLTVSAFTQAEPVSDHDVISLLKRGVRNVN